jgi:enoyl-CoA hydratase/carnithine racemase
MPLHALKLNPSPDEAASWAGSDLLAQVQGRIGVLTLNRPAAMNALTLGMLRGLSAWLHRWRDDPQVVAVLVRGAGRQGKPPAFCAGGDIRFLRQAALDGDPRLEDFFTEEYTLNHVVHSYPKPVVALMDGVCMGGGMGIAQGATLRVATGDSRLAMPETQIGLFPDVGGGWFLSRCPGRLGEYLALTGQVLGAGDAIAAGLADVMLPSDRLTALQEAMTDQPMDNGSQALAVVRAFAAEAPQPALEAQRAMIDQHFAGDSLQTIVDSLAADASPAAAAMLAALRRRSPLMLAVTLEQVRRARAMGLADELRMERGLVRHTFHLRTPQRSEVVEGIRALAVDKDHAPRWQPGRIEDVTPDMVAPFFASPWPACAHPLRDL